MAGTNLCAHQPYKQVCTCTTPTYLHEEPMVVLEDRAVVLLLHGGQFHVNDSLLLGGNVSGHVLLHTAQQMRRDAALQLLHL